jgi:hypothetical protein
MSVSPDDLPVELRIMIARYVLHHPEGLSWIWKNYRKGPRSATLRCKSIYCNEASLDHLSALSRACKLLYQEVRGLVLHINVIDFGFYSMHNRHIPRRCLEQSNGTSIVLNAIKEALDFLHTGLSRGLCASFGRIVFQGLSSWDLQEYRDEFLALVNGRKHLEITVPVTDWSLFRLGAYELERMRYLEEEDEPFTLEHEQMQEREDHYMKTGENVQDLVADIDSQTRNWRIYPQSITESYEGNLDRYLSEDEWKMSRAWEADGI